jgi:hypothetical protein
MKLLQFGLEGRDWSWKASKQGGDIEVRIAFEARALQAASFAASQETIELKQSLAGRPVECTARTRDEQLVGKARPAAAEKVFYAIPEYIEEKIGRRSPNLKHQLPLRLQHQQCLGSVSDDWVAKEYATTPVGVRGRLVVPDCQPCHKAGSRLSQSTDQ